MNIEWIQKIKTNWWFICQKISSKLATDLSSYLSDNNYVYVYRMMLHQNNNSPIIYTFRKLPKEFGIKNNSAQKLRSRSPFSIFNTPFHWKRGPTIENSKCVAQSDEGRKFVCPLPAETDEPCRHPGTSKL